MNPATPPPPKPGSNGDIRAWRATKLWQKFAAIGTVLAVLCTGVWFILTGHFQSKVEAAGVEQKQAVVNATMTETLKSINITVQQQAEETKEFQKEMRKDMRDIYRRLPPRLSSRRER